MLEEKYILYGVLGVLWIDYLWELYLALRQHMVYRETSKVPPELQTILDDETFQKARVYGEDKSLYNMVHEFFAIVILTIIIWMEGYVSFWLCSRSLLLLWGYSAEHEILNSILFMLIINLFNTLVNLPFNLYYTFVLEEAHGFNKQTMGFFLKDKLKKFAVIQVIVLPIVAALVYIIKWGGDYFFVYMWGFAFIAMLFLLTIYPEFIAPLFDKYTPLPSGDLRTKIEALAASVKFPLYKLYVVEGSKRSAHSNAYFYGFFKNKRIVLFDTLLEQYTPLNKNSNDHDISDDNTDKKPRKTTGCNNEEVLAILGHELGHWHLNHVLKNLILSQVNLFIMFMVFALLYKHSLLYKAFGFHDEQPVFIGLMIVLQYVFSPYNSMMTFLINTMSRRFEYQADAFAKKLGKVQPLCSALIKLNKDNLSFPVFDWLYSTWHHSHPELLDRLHALQKAD